MELSSAIDGLAARVSQVQNYLPDNINDYIKSRATEEFIRATGGQKGNQTAVQVAQGQYGQAQGMAQASGNPSLMNSIGSGQFLQSAGISVPLILLSAVGLWLLLKKRG